MLKILLIFYIISIQDFHLVELLNLDAVIDSKNYYTAGVVEFSSSTNKHDPVVILEDQLQGYLDIIESDEANDTDIIVFPEDTLNNGLQATLVPSTNDNISPCDMNTTIYSDFLIQLSCAARKAQKYLVINLSEKEKCPSGVNDRRPCAADGWNIFNTNVVFDRNGKVVSRYRKVNLFQEKKNTTYLPEYSYFETDFGVRFGQFICFDILFYTPAQELVERYNITDFVFSSMFFSEMPFLTAVQIQAAWSLGNRVNLLAAGASNPIVGSTGTGIYAAQHGALVTRMSSSQHGERRLYKARVPKIDSNSPIETTDNIIPEANNDVISVGNDTSVNLFGDLKLLTDQTLRNYTSELVKFTDRSLTTKELCHGSLCCTFSITLPPIQELPKPLNRFHYRIGVFDGKRPYVTGDYSYLRVCAVYVCADENVSSCGEISRLTSATMPLLPQAFAHISISGIFPNKNRQLIMPTSLDDRLLPLPVKMFKFSKEERSNDKYAVSNELLEEAPNVLVFGIYANYFDSGAHLAVGLRWPLLVTLSWLFASLFQY